jgi:TolB-like protein/DNA-binding winged helix-turn-helix (wHTH) protein/Tfp pilus assembly protein PilF
MHDTPRNGTFQFGDYELDLARGELLKFKRPIKLQPLHFTLLAALVENHDRIVTREELRQRLWGANTYVDFETGLNHCVRVLRATLSDDAQTPRYIETIPRRGYRFIAPVVTETEVQATSVEAAAPAQKAVSRKLLVLALSVAAVAFIVIGGYWLRSRGWPVFAGSRKIVILVLPFENLSGDPNQEYVSQGLTDEMISYLGKINPERLAVIARTSAIRYAGSGKDLRQIGQESGADYVQEGSVRRVGTRIRITARLTRTRDQMSVWSDSFDGDFSPDTVIAIQSNFASRIGSMMTGVLLVNPVEVQQTTPAAYEAFLKGRYHLNRRSIEGFTKAIENFDLAIQSDPTYAPAYAGKADTLSLFVEYYEKGAPAEAMGAAAKAANAALALDESLPEAHTSLAFVEWRYSRNYERAEREFRRAIELNPNSANSHHWYGLYLASRQRFPEAKLELEYARRLDPLSLVILTNIGWISYFEHDYNKAIRQYRSVVDMDRNFHPVHVKLVWAYQQQNQWEKAVAEQRTLAELAGAPKFAGQLEDIYKSTGYPDMLDELMRASKADWGPVALGEYEQARMYIIKGDRDTALRMLERCEAAHSPWLAFMDVEPAFEVLRNDPRFKALRERVASPVSPS